MLRYILLHYISQWMLRVCTNSVHGKWNNSAESSHEETEGDHSIQIWELTDCWCQLWKSVRPQQGTPQPWPRGLKTWRKRGGREGKNSLFVFTLGMDRVTINRAAAVVKLSAVNRPSPETHHHSIPLPSFRWVKHQLVFGLSFSFSFFCSCSSR